MILGYGRCVPDESLLIVHEFGTLVALPLMFSDFFLL